MKRVSASVLILALSILAALVIWKPEPQLHAQLQTCPTGYHAYNMVAPSKPYICMKDDGTHMIWVDNLQGAASTIQGEGLLYSTSPANLPNMPAIQAQNPGYIYRSASSAVDMQVVQTNSASCTQCQSNGLSVSYNNNAVSGHMGFLVFSQHALGGSPPTISDSSGDTWSGDVSAYDTFTWSDCNLKQGAHTITFTNATMDTHNGGIAYIEEIQGNPTSSCYDRYGTANYGTSNPLTVTTTNSVSQGTEYVIGIFSGFFSSNGGCPPYLSAGATYEAAINTCINGTGGYNGEQMLVERYTVNSGLSGTMTATAINSSAVSENAQIVTLKLSNLASASAPFFGQVPFGFIFRQDIMAPFLGPYYTASIGGSSVGAGACTTGTVTVNYAGVGMLATTTPETYPGAGFEWSAYIDSPNDVTVRVCNRTAGSLTPTASIYSVTVGQN